MKEREYEGEFTKRKKGEKNSRNKRDGVDF